MSQVSKPKANIPVAKMTSFQDVLKSSMTERMMLGVNPDYDVKFALASLYLADQDSKPGKRKISDCTPDSIIGALMRCAHAGLYPVASAGGGSKCGMYFIPFWSKDKNAAVVSLIPSYQALMMKASEDGYTRAIRCGVVYDDDDEFYYIEGKEQNVRHRPGPREGDVIGAWGWAELSTGLEVQVYLTHEQIMKRARAGGGGGNNPFWNKWADEMIRKTIIRHLCSQIPPNPKLAPVINRDVGQHDSDLVVTRDMTAAPAVDEAEFLEVEDNIDGGEDATKEAEKEETKAEPEKETGEKEKPKGRRGRPPGSKNKPKPAAKNKEPETDPGNQDGDDGSNDDGGDIIEGEVVSDGDSEDLSEESEALMTRVMRYLDNGVEPKKIRSLMREHLEKVSKSDPKGFEAIMEQLPEDE